MPNKVDKPKKLKTKRIEFKCPDCNNKIPIGYAGKFEYCILECNSCKAHWKLTYKEFNEHV